MKIISRIAVPLLCLLVTSTNGTAQQIKPGLSVKELYAFLVQVESRFSQEELIVEITCEEKKWGISTVKTTGERGQRIFFEKINEEWKKEGIDSYYGDLTKRQKPGISIKEICAFFNHTKVFLPQDEGIVAVEMSEKQITIRTASVYIPCASRGHVITFENTNGQWKKISQGNWLS